MTQRGREAERTALANKIKRSLRAQGFRISGAAIHPPSTLDKDKIRELHRPAVDHRLEVAKDGLCTRERELARRFAAGSEIDPRLIRPRLVEVEPDSNDELLFRFAALHWSIPVSSGYGRRLRFLVIDEQNEKLIGLFGLGDPVFSLNPRDEWVGWSKETRRSQLQHVMEAFVLGAVPPYSHLLGGKLVAMLTTSNEVRAAFRRKYAKANSVITNRALDGRLVMITTTSALGRSSIYNRVRFGDHLLFHPVGYTRGSGEFQFSNGLYSAVSDYAEKYCTPTAKQEAWGTGFRSRREVVRKTLGHLGLSTEWLYHGIKREVYAVPLAHNAREFLRGEHSKVRWLDLPAATLFDEFRERWLLPRAMKNTQYRYFDPTSLLLWADANER